MFLIAACFSGEHLFLLNHRVSYWHGLATPGKSSILGPDSQTFSELRNEALQQNVAILSGTTGKKSIRQLSRMLFDLESGDSAWQEVNWDRGEQFEACKLQCVAVTAVWRRLVFQVVDVPKNQLIVACSENFDEHGLNRAIEPIYEKQQRCPQCVDSAFSEIWIPKLRGPLRSKRKHHSTLQNLGAVLPLGTAIIERKHPLGQEVSKSKKRGKPVLARTLSTRTYRKAAMINTRRRERNALLETLGQKDKRAKMAFTKTLVKLSDRCRPDRRQLNFTAGGRQKRKTSAFAKFRSSMWNSAARPGAAGYKEEQQRIAKASDGNLYCSIVLTHK